MSTSLRQVSLLGISSHTFLFLLLTLFISHPLSPHRDHPSPLLPFPLQRFRSLLPLSFSIPGAAFSSLFHPHFPLHCPHLSSSISISPPLSPLILHHLHVSLILPLALCPIRPPSPSCLPHHLLLLSSSIHVPLHRHMVGNMEIVGVTGRALTFPSCTAVRAFFAHVVWVLKT